MRSERKVLDCILLVMRSYWKELCGKVSHSCGTKSKCLTDVESECRKEWEEKTGRKKTFDEKMTHNFP